MREGWQRDFTSPGLGLASAQSALFSSGLIESTMKAHLAAIIVMSVVAATPIDAKVPAEDPRVKSVKAVQVIASALRNYSADHEGKLPDTIKDLVPKYLSVAETWVPFVGSRHP